MSSELGALVFGAMLAKHPRAEEISKSLWSIKEVFLVGFFLQIGIDGLPDANAWLSAGVMTLLLPLKAVLLFLLLIFFKLRSRSAFLTSLSLTNYSEFGLIVASVVLPEWLIPLALTVAMSFVISAPLNRFAHPIYDRISNKLFKFERDTHHPDEQPVSLGTAQVLIMGLGRTGKAAYNHLEKDVLLIAMDSDPAKVVNLQEQGFNVFYADADAEANAIIVAGANETYLTMSEAGVGIAEHVKQRCFSNNSNAA